MFALSAPQEVVDYQTGEFEKTVRSVDVVLDTVGGSARELEPLPARKDDENAYRWLGSVAQ